MTTNARTDGSSGTLTTRAIGFSEFGGAEVLRPMEVELPAPGPGQVRITVRTAGVNPLDHKLRAGAMTELIPVTFPVVTGYEAAGVVEAVGEGVTAWRVGDEVFGPTWGGAHAEHVLVEAEKLARKPAGLGWAEAAAIPVAAETSWRVLDLLGVESGQTLLVHGAAGGVGTVLLQFARSRGIRVVGTASEANHEHLRALGAVPVTYGEGLADRVRAVAPEGVDRVLDGAGQGDVLPLSIELAGGAENVLSIADFEGAARYGVRFSGGTEAKDYNREALAGALALHEAGELQLPVHRVFPLAETAEAHRVSEHGHLRGKIVLAIG
ncbi:NADP-dependent oxidoreductase [Kitasatospora sp. CM 4170]|uniref:NADP-dependent oxidoreductase n=1 Tax=Kitasatospora aburaviensis TaxID=67265 RepID=A0ABW1ENQ3_9ACTN|nr:NADP-dependent oxidoreductase [Kitasatospora sp. CM 4170]WNM48418.1 NADP-dependent oxidoreductase [Kitasatospora sp. CM 4170]